MTTFRYDLSINDREMNVLSTVLSNEISLCEETPTQDSIYRASVLREIINRLVTSAAQTSGNNFFHKPQQ